MNCDCANNPRRSAVTGHVFSCPEHANALKTIRDRQRNDHNKYAEFIAKTAKKDEPATA